MDKDTIVNNLLEFIGESIDLDNVISIEANCGGIWIDMTDGKTWSLVLNK